MSSPTKSKSPVTEPRQTRSARTQAKILAVVEKHLLAESFDEVSVQDLVNEAGCSVGAFYGRFSNKSAAVYHFYDTRCSELETLMEALLNPDRPESLAEIVDEFVATIVNERLAMPQLSDRMHCASQPVLTILSRIVRATSMADCSVCCGDAWTVASPNSPTGPVRRPPCLFLLWRAECRVMPF